MARKKMAPIHPGEILREEFLVPMELSEYRLAKAMQVPGRRINEITHEKRGISADTALRLAQCLGTTAQFWMNLQDRYALDVTADGLGNELESLERVG